MNRGQDSVATARYRERDPVARRIAHLACRTLTLGLLATALLGCGQRGPLTLPAAPAAAPSASSPASAP